MSVTVRRACPEDASAIAKLALKLFAQHRDYDPERFADLGSIEGAEHHYSSRTTADDAIVFVADTDGEVLGFVYAEFIERDYAELLESAVWVHDLIVEEAARGTGAGKILIEAVAEAGKKAGADKLVLTAAAKNGSARRFFKERGFRETMVEMTLGLSGKD